jgi:hypothetical protein
VWWRRACPVEPTEQRWIESNLDWLVAEFGTDLLRGPVVLPTDDFFPGVYQGSHADVRRVVTMICEHVGVDIAGIDLELNPGDGDDELLAALPSFVKSSTSAAGHYHRRAGRPVVTVNESQAARPMSLVATVAHELGHVRLLDEGRVPTDRPDQEPLTDLWTVYTGLGIFTANSAFDVTRRPASWSTARLGYLTEPMYGYALAYYAWLRGEARPDWARHLDVNPRTYQRHGLSYLRRRPSEAGRPPA